MATNAAKTPSSTVRTIPNLINGQWCEAEEHIEVKDPYRKQVVARAPRSSMADLDAALKAATAAKTVMAAMPGYERAALLRRVKALLLERADAIAEVMTRETGKAIKDARGEVVRSQDTIELSAEEAVRIEGEQVPTSVAVPQAAIAQDQTGAYLFVVNDKNVVEQKRVRTGVSRDGMVAITSGLKEGERVIVQGQQRVRPGMTVNPSVAPSSASTQKQ